MTDRTADVSVQVRDLFNAKAAAWPSKYAPDGRLAGRLTRLGDAVAYHVPARGRVLDLGCGTGELTLSIATTGLRTTGCDISPEMLRIAAAAENPGNIDWVELEPGWQVLPFRAEQFDAVVASSVLEYVDDPATVLRECRRVLRPRGVLLCTVPDLRHPVRWLEWLTDLIGKEPALRAASRRWPRLDAYLTYLGISQQRHFRGWWRVAAAQANLYEANHQAHSPDRVPLRLFAFQRSDSQVGRGNLWTPP